jgi:predicted small integral membrane protein
MADWLATTFAWMAWTWQTGLLFVALFSTLAVMTVLAVRHPEVERLGVLSIATTRGDRLFLSILSAAIIHILWLALLGAPLLWGATVLSVIWAIGIFRYV